MFPFSQNGCNVGQTFEQQVAAQLAWLQREVCFLQKLVKTGGTGGTTTPPTTGDSSVTAEQIQRWNDGSRVVAVAIDIETPITGTTRHYHGLGTSKVWGDVRRANGMGDTLIRVVSANDDDPTTARNYVDVTIPAGESFTGRLRVEKILTVTAPV